MLNPNLAIKICNLKIFETVWKFLPMSGCIFHGMGLLLITPFHSISYFVFKVQGQQLKIFKNWLKKADQIDSV